jgi:hypothetical protein
MVIVLEKVCEVNVSKIYAHAYVYGTHPALSFRNPPWF